MDKRINMNLRLTEYRIKPKAVYTVFDEMAIMELLKTENEAEARAMAYNHYWAKLLFQNELL